VGVHDIMEGKPIHYDGSVQNNLASNAELKETETFTLTDEMRKNISGNPYQLDNIK
jgi:hypothetical protein